MFLNQNRRCRVFPPFSSRHRFLVHKTVDKCYPDLNTFSIGLDAERRLVVYKTKNDEVMDKSHNESSESIISNTSRMKTRRPDMQLYIPRARRKSNDVVSENTGKMSSPCVKSPVTDERVKNKIVKKKKVGQEESVFDRRSVVSESVNENCQNCSGNSDIQNFVEERRVKSDVKFNENATSAVKCEAKMSEDVVTKRKEIVVNEETNIRHDVKLGENAKSIDNVKSDVNFNINAKENEKLYEKNVECGLSQGLIVEIPETFREKVKLNKNVKKTDKLHIKKDDNLSESVENELEKSCFSENKAKNDEQHENVNKMAAKCANQLKIKSVSSCRIKTYESNDDGEEEENSWEALYNEDGDCLQPNLIKELTDSLGEVSIQKPKIDYTKFQFSDPVISESEFGHVIEIYDFPVDFKTQDLVLAFSQYKDRGFDIKWIDDTHALGLFGSPIAAADALTIRHPMMKTRALSEASRESKLKARRCGEFLQPYRPRPQTSAALARRLVTGALGLRVKIPREQQEKERQKLNEAKEKKKLAAKQKNDAWEGVIH